MRTRRLPRMPRAQGHGPSDALEDGEAPGAHHPIGSGAQGGSGGSGGDGRQQEGRRDGANAAAEVGRPAAARSRILPGSAPAAAQRGTAQCARQQTRSLQTELAKAVLDRATKVAWARVRSPMMLTPRPSPGELAQLVGRQMQLLSGVSALSTFVHRHVQQAWQERFHGAKAAAEVSVSD